VAHQRSRANDGVGRRSRSNECKLHNPIQIAEHEVSPGTNSSTSAAMIRLCGPVPRTAARSMPLADASFLASGEAKIRVPGAASTQTQLSTGRTSHAATAFAQI
jgi:hypothetical protein